MLSRDSCEVIHNDEVCCVSPGENANIGVCLWFLTFGFSSVYNPNTGGFVKQRGGRCKPRIGFTPPFPCPSARPIPLHFGFTFRPTHFVFFPWHVPMTSILPKKKQQILAFLKAYIDEHGYAPTLTDIARRFKVRSLATVHEHLEFLEKAGFLRRNREGVRELSVVEPEAAAMWSEAASVALPLVGLITAGKPIEAVEERDAMMSVPQEIVGRKNAYILKVRGDSMIESMIADGDFVVVEKTEFAQNGDMVVALLEDGTATLKKFYKHKNFIRLQPANKNYQPIDVPTVVIQGRVLGVIRRVHA